MRRIQTVQGRTAADCGELLVSLCYQPASDRLTVIVLKAKNLPRMDLTGLSGIFETQSINQSINGLFRFAARVLDCTVKSEVF